MAQSQTLTVKLELAYPMIALTIIFATCKLMGWIAWSWFWVMSPIWLVFAFIAFITGFIFSVIILQRLFR